MLCELCQSPFCANSFYEECPICGLPEVDEYDHRPCEDAENQTTSEEVRRIVAEVVEDDDLADEVVDALVLEGLA